jgi:hypothetical protein
MYSKHVKFVLNTGSFAKLYRKIKNQFSLMQTVQCAKSLTTLINLIFKKINIQKSGRILIQELGNKYTYIVQWKIFPQCFA